MKRAEGHRQEMANPHISKPCSESRISRYDLSALCSQRARWRFFACAFIAGSFGNDREGQALGIFDSNRGLRRNRLILGVRYRAPEVPVDLHVSLGPEPLCSGADLADESLRSSGDMRFISFAQERIEDEIFHYP